MGQLNVSFMDLGQENQRLKEELSQLQLDREQQLKQFNAREEELRAQITQIKIEKEDAESKTESTTAKLSQRDVQIKRLLTENARYLQDSDQSQANLKSM